MLLNRTNFIFFLFSIFFGNCVFAQNEPLYLKNQTYTYSELIDEYHVLAGKSKLVQIAEVGNADVGKPIHIVVIAKNGDFTPEPARASGKSILLINNGIHAGEACGIDASVELSKALLNPNNELHKALDSIVVLIIPVYNVGGMLNRSSYSRANQNGPKEYGFRGNARNLDLNRDFIKVDSKNAKTFTQLFHLWDPDIFIDTHTTNGSDHQYTLTLIATQKDKQNPVLSEFAQNTMVPTFYKEMKKRDMDMIPYVYGIASSPDKGIKDFMETPRYSSGYASLFDCFSFITEAHVFKPFAQRVQHTLGFLETAVVYTATNSSAIQQKRKEAKEFTMLQQNFPVHWQLDTSKKSSLPFNGYETIRRRSELTGQTMKFYNQNKPFSAEIDYFNTYKPVVEVKKPQFYVIPQVYSNVIDRLDWNQVKYERIKNDTLIEVSIYDIEDYHSPKTPYEGHFLHTEINVSKKKDSVQFFKGDVMVKTDQKSNRYIVETLEPQSVDGFFAWNFFDGILQQKEWFSDYAFEPKALDILKNDPELKEGFEEKKSKDQDFAKDSWAQLYYIYKKSPYYEKTVSRFPVYRIE